MTAVDGAMANRASYGKFYWTNVEDVIVQRNCLAHDENLQGAVVALWIAECYQSARGLWHNKAPPALVLRTCSMLCTLSESACL